MSHQLNERREAAQRFEVHLSMEAGGHGVAAGKSVTQQFYRVLTLPEERRQLGHRELNHVRHVALERQRELRSVPTPRVTRIG